MMGRSRRTTVVDLYLGSGVVSPMLAIPAVINVSALP